MRARRKKQFEGQGPHGTPGVSVGPVALVGFADAGKSSAARILAAHGYAVLNYADPIKDCLAAIFGWPRHLLEGDTVESRTFRETVDGWWARRLGIPGFSPRWAMRNVGTDVMRRYVHDEIWVFAMERRLATLGAARVVFGDVRHLPEIALTRRRGGKVVRVRRGPDPAWFATARRANHGDAEAEAAMQALGVHHSERAWIGVRLDATVSNDGSLADLERRLQGSLLI